MKPFVSFFSRLYQYATVCIVIGTPLFFVPQTAFSPETTYFITMMVLVAVALFSYSVSAVLTKSWYTVSKLEFISYVAFCSAIILSSIFSRDAYSSLFGETLTPLSGMALISLPVIMYLVRTLPEILRRKLKYVLVIILGVSAFAFMLGLIFTGKIGLIATQLFSGFSGTTSFAVYLGLFAMACFFFVRKVTIPLKYKIVVVTTAVIFITWIVSVTFQDSVRPNFISTISVGKSVMLHNGPFGIGAGNFNRAWQLYRPASVVASPYFGYEFNQGEDSMTTLFVTVGIVGLISFLLLVLSSLYSSYISYRQTHAGVDHFILGFITLTLFYFACVAWVVPLSYAVLVLWMVVSGLGVAKAQVREYRPSRYLPFLMIPVAVLLVLNVYIITQKARAFSLYGKAGALSSKDEAVAVLAKASAIYPFDGFYRAQVEYTIQSVRTLVATTTISSEELQNKYLEKTQMAIESARAAVKINPDNYQNYVSLGRAHELAIPFSKESEYGNAKQAYEEAVKLYPGNPYIYVMLARLEASAGTKEGARAQLLEALKKKQNFADALYFMSQLEASEQKIDEALMYAIEAVKNAPNDPLTYIQAGLLFYGKKDYQNAVTALKTALEKDPNNADVAYFLALTLRDGGRPDIAKPVVDELIRRNPGNKDLEALSKSIDILTATSTSSKATKTTNRGIKK